MSSSEKKNSVFFCEALLNLLADLDTVVKNELSAEGFVGAEATDSITEASDPTPTDAGSAAPGVG
jgi:hypothetical protein